VEAGIADGVLKITRPYTTPVGLKPSAPAIVQLGHNASMNRAYDEFCGDVVVEEREALFFSAKNVVFPTRDNVKSTFDNSAAGAPVSVRQHAAGEHRLEMESFGGCLDGLLVLSMR
jgi:hypothetical protein